VPEGSVLFPTVKLKGTFAISWPSCATALPAVMKVAATMSAIANMRFMTISF
jgi:hypothetical protein